ncbi:MAG: hypothetical protein PF570_01455 [Candidatus Cloacimonetes bacterium]|jgi:hypothetical protein|nr:hypothetical protein [Candidatus Cloacimonadota bacterium]
MKKFISLIIIMLLLTSLFGIREFACMFTLINPSATDVAFGLGSGTANIWNTNPLSVWSNPAKLGYHKNLAFGYSNDSWFENVVWIDFDMYHQSSYISYGWNGIGVLLPAPSAKSHWGTFMDYGEQTMLDEYGNVISTFESYDACSKFAVGVNVMEFVSNFISNESFHSLQYYGDLSIGYNYDNIISELVPEGSGGLPPGVKGAGETNSSGVGYIGRISPFNKINAAGKFYRLDLTAGIYYLNPERTKISYINESQPDPMPYGTRSAFSCKFSIDSSLILEMENDNLRCIIDNLFSIYYSQDNVQYGEKDESNPSVWGEGIEIAFFDIFYIRKGQYVDRRGEMVGDTDGIGINLNYKDILQFQYNKTKFPGGEFQNKQ